MIIDTLNEKALARLQHIDSQLNGRYGSAEYFVELENRIVNMEGNPYGCLLSLQGYCEAKAISTWFHTENLSVFKNWCYTKSKLHYISHNPPYGKGSLRGPKVFPSMYYLLSDHTGLIEWYSTAYKDFDDNVNNTKSLDYWIQQLFLALRGDWDTLGERCERIIADPPKASLQKKLLADHRFYLALAKGDSVGMETIIKEFVTPRGIYNRRADEEGYTANLISTPAIIYSKLAWRNGYKVVVDSPYIPKEWLPIKPLETYEDTFDFMKVYKI